MDTEQLNSKYYFIIISLLLFCLKVLLLPVSLSLHLRFSKQILQIHHPRSCSEINSCGVFPPLSSFFESVNLPHFFSEYIPQTPRSHKRFSFSHNPKVLCFRMWGILTWLAFPESFWRAARMLWNMATRVMTLCYGKTFPLEITPIV